MKKLVLCILVLIVLLLFTLVSMQCDRQSMFDMTTHGRGLAQNVSL